MRMQRIALTLATVVIGSTGVLQQASAQSSCVDVFAIHAQPASHALTHGQQAPITLSRAEQMVAKAIPALASRSQPASVIVDYMLQSTFERSSEVSRFLRSGSLPDPDLSNSRGTKLSQEAETFIDTLEKLDKASNRSASMFGRLLRKIKRGPPTLEALVAELERSDEARKKLLKEVEKENASLAKIFPEVHANFAAIKVELEFLNELSDTLSHYAWALPSGDPLRTVIENEVGPRLMKAIVDLRPLQVLAESTIDAIEQRTRTNSLALEEGRNAGVARTAFERRANEKIKELLKKPEDTYCVKSEFCTGDVVWAKMPQEHRETQWQQGVVIGAHKKVMGGTEYIEYNVRLEKYGQSTTAVLTMGPGKYQNATLYAADSSIDVNGYHPGDTVIFNGRNTKLLAFTRDGSALLYTTKDGKFNEYMTVSLAEIGRTNGEMGGLKIGDTVEDSSGRHGRVAGFIEATDQVYVWLPKEDFYFLYPADKLTHLPNMAW